MERLRQAWDAAGQSYEIRIADIAELELPCGGFDAAIALYSLQHMIRYEPMVWVRIRQWLKRGGHLIGAARYRIGSPRYEGDRGDPLMSQDETTIMMLAGFCGFRPIEIQPITYTESEYAFQPAGSPAANAVLFAMEAT
jgi:hypothetical protein